MLHYLGRRPCLFYNTATIATVILVILTLSDLSFTYLYFTAASPDEEPIAPSSRKRRWDALEKCLHANEDYKDKWLRNCSVLFNDVRRNMCATPQWKNTINRQEREIFTTTRSILNQLECALERTVLVMTLSALPTSHRSSLLCAAYSLKEMPSNYRLNRMILEWMWITLSTLNLLYSVNQAYMHRRSKERRHCRGLDQLLTGCEVAVDVHKNSVVCGIVTTPTDWTFLRYCNEIIEKHEIALLISNSEISSESSKETTGYQISSMLSDDWLLRRLRIRNKLIFINLIQSIICHNWGCYFSFVMSCDALPSFCITLR